MIESILVILGVCASAFVLGFWVATAIESVKTFDK